MKGARGVDQVALRMPDDLRIYLKHKAIDNRRSLNGELVVRLEDSRKREEQEAKKGAQS